MNNEKLLKTGELMIELTACALHGIRPEQQMLEKADLAALLQMGRFQSLTVILATALEDAWASVPPPDPAIAADWKKAKAQEMRRTLLIEAERNEILRLMEQNEIWHMPLKGSVLSALYPRFGMRQMTDVDILFDKNCRHKLKKIMTARGYRVAQFGQRHHDIYEKPPVYTFEMHIELAEEPYYAGIEKRLLKSQERPFEYVFSDEDFYIYMVFHTYKHYCLVGTGLRSLADCYIYLQHKERTMDRSYIERELAALGIDGFEAVFRSLSEKLFAPPGGFRWEALSDSENTMLVELLQSGARGTVDMLVQNRLKKLQPEGGAISGVTKWKYYWSRLFPDAESIRQRYPSVTYRWWKLPFLWVYRVYGALTSRRKNLKRELLAVKKRQQDK